MSPSRLKELKIKLNHRKILAGIAGLLGADSKLIAFTVALDNNWIKIGKEGVINELKSIIFSSESLGKFRSAFGFKRGRF